MLQGESGNKPRRQRWQPLPVRYLPVISSEQCSRCGDCLECCPTECLVAVDGVA